MELRRFALFILIRRLPRLVHLSLFLIFPNGLETPENMLSLYRLSVPEVWLMFVKRAWNLFIEIYFLLAACAKDKTAFRTFWAASGASSGTSSFAFQHRSCSLLEEFNLRETSSLARDLLKLLILRHGTINFFRTTSCRRRLIAQSELHTLIFPRRKVLFRAISHVKSSRESIAAKTKSFDYETTQLDAFVLRKSALGSIIFYALIEAFHLNRVINGLWNISRKSKNEKSLFDVLIKTQPATRFHIKTFLLPLELRADRPVSYAAEKSTKKFCFSLHVT